MRGVSVRSSIIRTLQEREWIRVVGHRDVPGKPALFGTTKGFLDYFGLASLDDLPSLAEIKDMDNLEPELDLGAPGEDDPDEDSDTPSGEDGGEVDAAPEDADESGRDEKLAADEDEEPSEPDQEAPEDSERP